MIVHGLILLLLVSVGPINSLLCYECYCSEPDITACDCGSTTEEDYDADYCVIIEQRDIFSTYIDITRIPRNSTWLYINDPYFILALESIRYNVTASQWNLWTTNIIYGCDWDLCNSPNLINVLPDSFKLSIDTNWLNTNIYGTGSTDSCNDCPRGLCSDNENPLNFTECPLTTCINVTSCLAFDLWNDLATGQQCFYSECAPSYLDGEFAEYYGGKYRIDIEAVVYLAQNRSKYEIWEIDVYCAVYNCTRSTIFQEVTQQLSSNISDLSIFPLVRPTTTTTTTTTTPIQNPLTCYSCDCIGASTCPCDLTVLTSLDTSYCVLVRENFGQFFFVYSGYSDFVDINMYINEFPFALVEESIGYDENGGLWYTTTNYIVYGCNWNLCNKPELGPYLPNSYQMRLPEAWLNSSILGSGLPVRDCHECRSGPQCGGTDYLDANTCPIQPCNTTCLVIDTYDDPTYDYLCYQSYCLLPDEELYPEVRHRIEIEGVVYASEQNVVEIWEIDIYCRADNCSRPGIFRELHQQLTLQVGSLSVLFNETHDPTIPQRRCYDCYCDNQVECSCDKTTIMSANSTYCIIMRQNYGQDIWIDFGHISQESSSLYIRDFPYLLTEESILYSEQTGLWNTITNYVVYGCNWDYCNDPDLVQYLPNAFQMRLPESWLNSSILGTGQPVRNCHQCPDDPVCSRNDSIDGSLCPVLECNTTCLILDTYDDPAHELLCYQSFCIPPDSEFYAADRHRIELEGILYLQNQERTIEVWSADIYCRADDCSRPSLFSELKSQLYGEYGDISAFERATTTVIQSTVTQSIGTSTTPVLVLWTVPSTSLTCYKCECPSFNTSACDCSTWIDVEEGAHCTIIEDFNPLNQYLELSSAFLNSSYIRIKDPYYIIVDESISYNETSVQWETKTKRVVYGCDWDYCNRFALISFLPDTFKLTIDSTWLTENIYGNGSVNSCHNCSDGICGNATHSINYDLCSYSPCDNSTTCSLRDLWQDLETNELCYRSECTPSGSADEVDEKYKVQIEAIVYLAQNRSNFDIWELDINCAADNCSRPTIFQEIKEQIQGEVSDLTNFPTDRPATTAPPPAITTTTPAIITTAPAITTTTPAITTTTPAITTTTPAITTTTPAITTTTPAITTTTPAITTTTPAITTTTPAITTTAPAITTTAPANPLYCYHCSCTGTVCPCTTSEVSSADNVYCSIIRTQVGQYIYINYGHIFINSTYYYIRDYPYILVGESIIYDETSARWNTQTELAIYGCNTNLCNKPDLLPYLPTSFQMRLSESWLNSSILGTGQPVRDCHECPDNPVCSDTDFIDGEQCPIQPCNTTCLVSDTFEDPANTQQCYQSFCAPQDSGGYVINTHRVYIEGVLYASNPNNVEIWEIDIYCRADNCSSPEIFNELKGNLTLYPGDLTYIFNQTIQVPKIRCFDCSCASDQNCTCDTVSTATAESTYCTIARNYDGNNVNVYFSHNETGSSDLNIREFPFVLVEESILYNNETGQWFTRSNEILYGCNWDYCNRLSLLPLLPASLIMSLPDSWLNSSILGTGQPAHDCQNCTDSICSINNIFDGSLCPVQSCSTTCFVSNKYVNFTTNEQCYQSYCLPENTKEGTDDTQRVEVQGIVYPSQPNFELKEANIYCRVDNCSRPEIFQEIKENLVVETGNLSALFDQTSIDDPGQIRCYTCYCMDDPICACGETTTQPAGESYCTIIREYDGQNFWIIMEHVDRNSSRAYIREFPYMLVEESIFYTEATGQWTTRPSLVVYGCNTDYCNDPLLIPYLPITFQMTLNETWLNTSVLGTGQPQRECHQCPDAPQCGTTDFLDIGRCPVQSCNTTCFVADTFDDPLSDLLCYQSYCLDEELDENDIYRHLVEIEGIIYGNLPNAQLELWEIDIYCRADDCSRPEIFNELREQLKVDLGDLSAFFNITTITTTPTPPVEPTITCYACYCINDPICACDETVARPAGESYCSIIREFDGQDVWIIMEHVDRNSSRAYIRDFPFVLVEESIYYNQTTGNWANRPSLVVYGCNLDYCNPPSLIPYLPITFQMTLNETWLNTSVLGTGQPQRECHQCPDAPQCGTTDFLDIGRCPVQSCNTTCFVADTFDDPLSDLLCYQSYCLDEELDENDIYRHLVEIEGIVYGNTPNPQLELWEIDIYCRADDCSRPETFNELRQQLIVDLGDLSILNMTAITTTPTPPVEPTITCYACYCINDPICACDETVAQPAGESYCSIIREFDGEDVWIIMEHVDRNSSRAYIRDFPFVLVEESIYYNQTTGNWALRPSLVVYGCNWDYCNHPSLIPYLPITFQMTLNETWLNTSVLGTGQPQRECHQCPDAPQCGTTDFLDIGRCPVRSCNTTCFVADTFDDPLSDLLCYQSYCLDEELDEYDIYRHLVEIEGIVYGNTPNPQLELWEIDIYCRADDCSRPEIFNELRQQLIVDLGDLSILNMTAITTTPAPPIERTITCYDCSCYDDPICSCDQFSTVNASRSYCTILRQDYDEDTFFIALQHIGRNSTRVFIREFPFLLAEESIIYNDSTTEWNTKTNLVMYGCNWDYCNHPSLVPLLPNSFQMRLNESWLNTNVLGTGQPVRSCHNCPDAPVCSTTDFIDGDLCPITECNTTCLVSDTFDDPDSNLQCYQSYCAPPDSDFFTIDPHRVELEGILYLYPMGRPVELWEVDVFCRGDNCSRPTIFDEITDQLTVVLGDISAFYNMTTPQTSSTTTGFTSTMFGSTTTLSSSTSPAGPTTSSSSTSPASPTTSSSSTSPAGSTTSSSSTSPAGPTTSSSSTSPAAPTTSSSSTSPAGPTTTTGSTGASSYVAQTILILFFLTISLLNFILNLPYK